MTPTKIPGTPNSEEEMGQGLMSQRNAFIWSVSYLFDSFIFLSEYLIHIPKYIDYGLPHLI